MVSLVVASWNRVAEMERLLTSLDAQGYPDLELIVVDQNPDDRLRPLFQRHPALTIRHIRTEKCGASKGRNIGLSLVSGDIVAFPDDDCWYPDQLLHSVVGWFEQNPDYDLLFTAIRDEKGRLMAPKFPPRRGACTKRSVLGCAVTFNAFARVKVIKAIGFFREDIGPGASSPYQSGDDLDYLIRPVEFGFAAWYEPSLTVYHPNFNSKERLLKITYSYAQSVGLVLRLHNYPWWVVGNYIARSFCGALVHLCKLDLQGARLYSIRAKGQFWGYFSNKFSPGESQSRSMGAGHS